MNILLLNGLPEDYDGIPISPDFRNMVQVDLILHDTELSETDRAMAALYQLYPDIPEDIPKAIDGLIWFFSCGRSSGANDAGSSARREKKGFDFDQDANYIFSAFYSTYMISLSTIDFLHWWEFMALFEGLPENTLIQRIIYWRTADTSNLSKGQREYVEKMRNLFALKGPEREPMSIEEINQQTKDRVARRFAEVERLALERGVSHEKENKRL